MPIVSMADINTIKLETIQLPDKAIRMAFGCQSQSQIRQYIFIFWVGRLAVEALSKIRVCSKMKGAF